MISSAVSTTGASDSGLAQLARQLAQSRSAAGKGGAGVAASASGALSPAQQQTVARLREIDRAVHAHEAAHIAVGGDLIRGGAEYSYAVGPDKKRYAVSGEVSIDVSPGRTPQQTIPKAEHIRATALAPADPSAQDRSVAAAAARMGSQAQRDLDSERAVQRARENAGSAAGTLYGADGQPATSTGSVLDQYA